MVQPTSASTANGNEPSKSPPPARVPDAGSAQWMPGMQGSYSHRWCVTAVRQFKPTGIVPQREFTKSRYALVSPVRTFFQNIFRLRPCEKVRQVAESPRGQFVNLCSETACAGTFRPRPLGSSEPSGPKVESGGQGAKWLGRPPEKVRAHCQSKVGN